jgi:CxxC motif-containing protein (DUF1111 family)
MTMRMTITHRPLLVVALTLGSLSTTAHAGLGDPVPGLTAEELALFQAGKALYEKEFTPSEGLGPLFRETACVTCHGLGGTGGADPAGADNNVTHFGLEVSEFDRFYEAHELGGPVQQHRSIAGHPEAPDCTLPGETDPEILQTFLPDIIISKRHSPAVWGFGLIDAIPDQQIIRLQGKKPWKRPGVVGAVNWGVEIEGLDRARVFTLDPTPRTAVVGPTRAGRFGWKSQTGTLFQFTAEPMNIELGLTGPFFRRENTASIGPNPAECIVADDAPNDPNSEIARGLYYFQAFLAPPARGPQNLRTILGEIAFVGIGCADCHAPAFRTGDYHVPWTDGTAHKVEALSNKVIEPWSDFLIHDLGEENSDRRQMGAASGRFWRTTPLWGLRTKTNLWHDGSVPVADLGTAIAKHGGEGSVSRAIYGALPGFLKGLLHDFLRSL